MVIFLKILILLFLINPISNPPSEARPKKTFVTIPTFLQFYLNKLKTTAFDQTLLWTILLTFYPMFLIQDLYWKKTFGVNVKCLSDPVGLGHNESEYQRNTKAETHFPWRCLSTSWSSRHFFAYRASVMNRQCRSNSGIRYYYILQISWVGNRCI